METNSAPLTQPGGGTTKQEEVPVETPMDTGGLTGTAPAADDCDGKTEEELLQEALALSMQPIDYM